MEWYGLVWIGIGWYILLKFGLGSNEFGWMKMDFLWV